MKISNIEVIPIYPRLAKRYEDRKVDLYGIECRTVFKMTTDNGIVGYGDQRVRPGGQPDPSIVEPFIGRDPFDFLNNNLTQGFALNGALYDVLGKYLEVPAYKLMGQKVRNRVSVAAWTRPASPEHFAKEIQRAAEQGYTKFKIHTCEYYDVFQQTRAAEEVAPEGFKIHYDFNSNRSIGAVLPIISELERNHPIVGYIEDPLVKDDIDGWRRLREQTRIPIIMHGTPCGGVQEVIQGMADIYMISGTLGEMMATGIALGQAKIQTIVQLDGGTLGKAMAMHMAAVLPTHTAHSINLDDQYEEDITTELIPVIEGASPVPEGPGLGYEVDEEALARLAAQEPVEKPEHIHILRMPSGRTYYNNSYAAPNRLAASEEGTVRGFESKLWEDDGSEEFRKMHDRIEKDGSFSE